MFTAGFGRFWSFRGRTKAGSVTLVQMLHSLSFQAPVSFDPVFFCLHLCESRHCPLEGKHLLFSAEDGQAAGFLLFNTQLAVVGVI